MVIFNGGLRRQVRHRRARAAVQEGLPEGDDQARVGHQRSPRRCSPGSPAVPTSGRRQQLRLQACMDFGALVADGQLADLTDAVRRPVDRRRRARRSSDTVVPGTVDVGSFNGKPYVLNYVYTVFGIWYSGEALQGQGLDRADDVGRVHSPSATRSRRPASRRSATRAPTPPYYMCERHPHLAPRRSVAPTSSRTSTTSRTAPGQPTPVKQAAAAWAEIGAKYSDKSFLGLKHTDVQLQQNQDKMAFYPSRRLAGERAGQGSTPADFEYAVDADPGGDRRRQDAGRPRSARPPVRATSSPRKGKNPRAAWSTCARCSPRRAARASPSSPSRLPWSPGPPTASTCAPA